MTRYAQESRHLYLSGGGRETVFRANSVSMISSRLAWFCFRILLRRKREQQRGDARERDGDKLEPARECTDHDKRDDRRHQWGARIRQRGDDDRLAVAERVNEGERADRVQHLGCRSQIRS